jgi:nitrate reductase NapD
MSPRTRRELLSGWREQGLKQQTHISSAVIAVLPSHRERVAARLAGETGVEVHHATATKLVIVLEALTSGALGAKLAEIAGWPGVLSANMVFEQALDLPGDLT